MLFYTDTFSENILKFSITLFLIFKGLVQLSELKHSVQNDSSFNIFFYN